MGTYHPIPTLKYIDSVTSLPVNINILVPKTIEIIWVSAAHTASYNFISLTPLFFNKIK